LGAGVEDDDDEPEDGADVLGAALGSDIALGAGAGCIADGVGAVVGAAVWAAAPAGAKPSTAAARRGANCVFIVVRVTW